jgi:hypothetical protein
MADKRKDFSSTTYANLYGPQSVRQKMKLGPNGRFVVDKEGPQDYKTSKFSNRMLGLAKESAMEARKVKASKGATKAKPRKNNY